MLLAIPRLLNFPTRLISHIKHTLPGFFCQLERTDSETSDEDLRMYTLVDPDIVSWLPCRLGRMYDRVLKSREKATEYYKEALLLAQTLYPVPFTTPWFQVITSLRDFLSRK